MKEYSLVKYIKYRIKCNKNFLAILTGPTGSGKSWTALSIGELLDDNFNIGRVVFSGTELMKLINSNELKSGSVVIWDEAGVNLSNRNWQSGINKMMNLLLQTFRHRNIILIFTVPYQDFVDAATRKLFHGEFQTVSINKAKKTCMIKPKLMQYNANMKKMYYHYLIVKGPNGGGKIRRWNVPKPSSELIKSYEKKKTRFTDGLNASVEMTMRQLEYTDDVRKPLTKLQKGVRNLLDEGMRKQKEIAAQLGTSQPVVSIAEKYLRKKGYWKEEYDDKPQEIEKISDITQPKT